MLRTWLAFILQFTIRARDLYSGATYAVRVELSACLRSHGGVSLLLVRTHLLKHFSFIESSLPISEEVAAAAAAEALHDLAMDSRFLGTELEDMLSGIARLRIRGYHCRLGGVALRLLRCLTSFDSRACSARQLEDDLRLALGLDADVGPVDVLRSLWPLHMLVASLVAVLRGTDALGSERLDLLRHLQLRASSLAEEDREVSVGKAVALANMSPAHRDRILATMPTCPFRSPYDFIFCELPNTTQPTDAQVSPGHSEEGLATASVLIARANARMQRLTFEAEPWCSGFINTCAAAVLDTDVEGWLNEAATSLRTALGPSPVLGTLASTSWPVLELLSQTASLVNPGHPAVTSRRHPGSLTAGVPSLPQMPTPCACDLRTWRVGVVQSLAAALRTLARLWAVRGHAEGIRQVARSDDARTACPASSGLLEGLGSFEDLTKAFYGVQFAWGNNPLQPDAILTVPEEVLIKTANRLWQAPPEDFGADICLPGAIALTLVCFLVAIEQRKWSWWRVFEQYYVTLTLGGLQCVEWVADKQPVTHAAAAYEQYLQGWAPLAAWQRDNLFMQEVLGPFVSSNLWWLGKEVEDEAPMQHVNSSLSACAGVAEPGDCADREDVITRGPVTSPLTRVLGVGLMKAGSTFVVQALRAATGLPMGMDCSIAHLVTRVQRREEPLRSILERCSEEVFKWELAKDPGLTPVARELAAVWPTVAANREPLRLYFLVRNPLDFIRALLRHLEVDVDGGPARPAQLFSLGNWPNHDRFTVQKQLYLDIERNGLRYTGYVDAAAQRWVLTVDEYLRCPAHFALVRYEDFKADPVRSAELLLQKLGLGKLWSEDAADRVRKVAAMRYQALPGAPRGTDGDAVDSFGERLHARIAEAIGPRAAMLGYPDLVPREPTVRNQDDFPIHLPPLPVVDCLM